MDGRYFTAIILTVAVLFISGCNPKPDTGKMLATYMTARYPSETFSFEYYDWSAYDTTHYTTYEYFSGTGIGFAKGEILAYCRYENGQWQMADNYLMLLHRAEIEEYLQSLAEEIYGPCEVYIFYHNLYIPSTESASMTAGELIDIADVEADIFLPPDSLAPKEYDEKKEAFWKKLYGQGHAGVDGYIWETGSQEDYDEIVTKFDRYDSDRFISACKKVGSFGQHEY